MKKYPTLSFLILFLSSGILFSQTIEIPRASPKASIGQTIGVCKVTLDYGRPSARNRKIFGELVPYNKVWRAGANEATVISFNYTVNMGGKDVPPGKYGLFAIPNKDSWTVILNSDWGQWGAYNYDKKEDVLRFEVLPQKVNHTEICTYTFTDVTKSSALLKLAWEDQSISIPIQTATHSQTVKEIEKVVAASVKNWYNFSAAAQYYFYERKEAEKALNLIDTAIELHAPNPAPWMLKSQILASQSKYKEAITYAEEAIEVSRNHNFLFEIEENEVHITKWKLALQH